MLGSYGDNTIYIKQQAFENESLDTVDKTPSANILQDFKDAHFDFTMSYYGENNEGAYGRQDMGIKGIMNYLDWILGEEKLKAFCIKNINEDPMSIKRKIIVLQQTLGDSDEPFHFDEKQTRDSSNKRKTKTASEGRRVVKENVDYQAAPYGHIAIIPAGTPVIPATNLPEDNEIKYWVENWEGMSEQAESWARNYGFGLSEDQVTTLSPEGVPQREPNANDMVINGKVVDEASIEIDGTGTYPDFEDDYVSAAWFEDGTELTENEIAELEDKYQMEIYDMKVEKGQGAGDDYMDYLRDASDAKKDKLSKEASDMSTCKECGAKFPTEEGMTPEGTIKGCPKCGSRYIRKAQETVNINKEAKKKSNKEKMDSENPCWDGYEMVGTKIKDGKKVPNCVPKKKEKI